MQTRFAGLSSYKRKSNRGLTSLDNMNAAVKEVLDEGRKCHAVATTRNISEATLRRHCSKVRTGGLKRSDTRKTDACSAHRGGKSY